MIKYIMEQQVKKAKAEAVASSGPAIDEEEIKRRAIEEYLARQAAANAKPAEEAPAAEEKKED